MSELHTAPEETRETALHRGRLGVLGIVFFVVAAAAPLVGMTGAVPVAIVAGNGAAAPGAYLVVGIILLLFSVGYAAMATKVTNVGAFFAFVGRGLGIIPGVGSAFVSLVAYLAVQLAVFGFFGGVISGQMKSEFGLDLPWYVWTLIAWALVTGLSALSVDIGAKVLGLLMTLELLSLVITASAVMLSSKKPEGVDLGASFSLPNIFVGGLGSTAGIALAFAFASYIGFEATAIYGEESRDPHRTVPRATYLAVIAITVIFGFTAFGIVTGLGASKAVDQTVALSTVDGTPLADPANVLFTVADSYVGGWMRELMSWLVVSSLFAGLLAFQNSAARYLYAMGRAGVLSERLDRVNRRGAPWTATVTTSVISLVVILVFAIGKLDPVVNLFFWMSGMAVIAIVFVEILVSIAVIAFFSRHRGDASVWASVVAPILSIVGLVVGLWLLASRFGLLAGTVAEGVDPTQQAWGLNTTGWVLVIGPFVMFVVGLVVGRLRLRTENEDAIADLVT
jgi:amino acid transporter